MWRLTNQVRDELGLPSGWKIFVRFAARAQGVRLCVEDTDLVRHFVVETLQLGTTQFSVCVYVFFFTPY